MNDDCNGCVVLVTNMMCVGRECGLGMNDVMKQCRGMDE